MHARNGIGHFEDNNESFSLKAMYEVTAKEASPKNVGLYHRLMFIKTNGVELCYNVLENAGLNRTRKNQC